MSTRASHALLAIAAAGLVLVILLSVYVWRQAAFNVLLLAAFLWLLGDRFAAEARDEETRAVVDQLADDMTAVKALLTGNELPSTGRHVKGEPPTYDSPTWPRSA